METIIRGLIVYGFLLLIFRISGKRTLSQTTTFDLVLTLIISETVQEALIDGDRSMTNGLTLVTTLVMATVGLSLLKQRFPTLDKWLEGRPLLLIDRGEAKRECMDKCRVDDLDLLEAARRTHGLERIDQIKYAVLERNGDISIVAKESK